jgi:MraZ protein
MALLFYSAYELKIDAKNRLVIPADVRKAIESADHGTAIFVTYGNNHLPWLYAEKHYDSLVSQIPLEMTPDVDLLAYTHKKFSMASKIPWDELGRMVLPERILKWASLPKEVTLVGAGDHLELWDRQNWNDRLNYLSTHDSDVESKGKTAMNAFRTMG